jgi:hypothetical protein
MGAARAIEAVTRAPVEKESSTPNWPEFLPSLFQELKKKKVYGS